MIYKVLKLLLLFTLFTACQSTLIKNERFKIAVTPPEIGSVGQSKSLMDLQNSFEVKTLTNLENNIRVAVTVIPYHRRLANLYKRKQKFNQKLLQLNYIDSLPSKPEVVLIKILDVTGFISEVNASHNTAIKTLIESTPKTTVVSSIAIDLPINEIQKIRDADAFYLTNSQEKKYTLSLYKTGKKTETINLNSETILAYQTSRFCWDVTERGKWYVADMIQGKMFCNGNTKSKISEKKKSRSLFKM